VQLNEVGLDVNFSRRVIYFQDYTIGILIPEKKHFLCTLVYKVHHDSAKRKETNTKYENT
jgi:hypothetical protein